MVVVVNMLLVFLEPPSSTFLLNDCEASSTSQQESACWGVQNKMQESRFVEGSFTPNFAAFLLEMFCCAIYAVDIFVLLRFYGLKPVLRMRHKWVSLKVVVVPVLAINAVLSFAIPVIPHFARLLRPVLFISRFRNARKIFSSLVRSTVKIGMAALLLVFWIVIGGILVFVLFSGIDSHWVTVTRYAKLSDPSAQMLSPPPFSSGAMRDCSSGGCTKLAPFNWGVPLVGIEEHQALVIKPADLLPVGLAAFAEVASNFTGIVPGVFVDRFLVHLNGADHCTPCILYGSIEEQPVKCSTPTYQRKTCSVFKKNCFNYFPSLYESMIKMFTLITTANYPDVMMPAYDCHWVYGIVFVVWEAIGLYFIMSLLLAVAYNQFQNRTALKLTSQMRKRSLGLQRAFDLLAVRAHSKKVLSVPRVSSLSSFTNYGGDASSAPAAAIADATSLNDATTAAATAAATAAPSKMLTMASWLELLAVMRPAMDPECARLLFCSAFVAEIEAHEQSERAADAAEAIIGRRGSIGEDGGAQTAAAVAAAEWEHVAKISRIPSRSLIMEDKSIWIQELGLAIDFESFEAIVPLVELKIKHDKSGARMDNDAAQQSDDEAASAGLVLSIARSESAMMGHCNDAAHSRTRCAPCARCASSIAQCMRNWDYALARLRATRGGQCATAFVRNPWLQFVLDLVVAANTVCILMELTFEQSFGSEESAAGWWSATLETGFLAFYCIELSAKMLILGARRFFDEGFFNHLDFVTVIIGIIGTIVSFIVRHATSAGGAGALNVLLKLPRLLRLVRIIRLLKLFDDIVYTFAKIVSPVCRYVLVLVIVCV